MVFSGPLWKTGIIAFTEVFTTENTESTEKGKDWATAKSQDLRREDRANRGMSPW
jgi:hypothetical protein